MRAGPIDQAVQAQQGVGDDPLLGLAPSVAVQVGHGDRERQLGDVVLDLDLDAARVDTRDVRDGRADGARVQVAGRELEEQAELGLLLVEVAAGQLSEAVRVGAMLLIRHKRFSKRNV